MSKLGIIFTIIISLIAMVGISFFVVDMVLNPSAKQIKTIIIPVGNPKEPSITNINGSHAYLKYSMSIEVNEDLYKKPEGKSINKTDAIAQDVAIQILRSQKPEDLRADKQDMLRDKLKAKINEVLGKEVIVNVYLSNFVIAY